MTNYRCPNINRKFQYFCKNNKAQMTIEASIGILDKEGPWHVSFSCERSNCPKSRNCNRLRPKQYLKSEASTITELMKRIENEP